MKHKKSFSPQDSDFEKFDTAVRTVEEIDPYGMTFRYPDDKKGGQASFVWQCLQGTCRVVSVKFYSSPITLVDNLLRHDRLIQPT